MKQKLQRKLKKSGGFTLIEMLIVVAIIAILVAVSIPVVGGSLNKARTATDDANLRAAKAAALIEYMTENTVPETATYYYDANKGVVATSSAGISAYGKASGHQNSIVKVVIDADGVATATWESVS